MKTIFLHLSFLLSLTLSLNAQVGSAVIYNAQNTNPKFIVSLNGIRPNNQYAQTVRFDYPDEYNYHVKILQSGATGALDFNIMRVRKYTSVYALNKDSYGTYSLVLESKTLRGNLSTAVTVPGVPTSTASFLPAGTATTHLNTFTSSEFTGVYDAIKKESFEPTKLEMAKTFFATKDVSSAQVLGVIKLLSMEKSNPDFSKFAYLKTYDRQNYYKIYDAFSFSSS